MTSRRVGRNGVLAVLVALWFVAVEAGGASGIDRVVVRRDGQQRELEGRVLVEAQDGGALLLATDGVLWPIQPDEMLRRDGDARPFVPLGPKELATRLRAELPAGFDALQTTHYVILFNTSRAYAQWCGSLFERLYMALTNYWSRRGLALSEPEFPLVAVVFADRRGYLESSRAELGSSAESIIGYYHLQTNRITMYDLTGLGMSGSTAGVRQFLAQGEAARSVATIVHEAVHQIAFNCGMHQRLSDCPLWFSEGVAIYFETPDLNSAKGWRGIGAINQPRLARWREYLRGRPADSLRTLIATDERFRDPKAALDAYAEAWALTYYLLKSRPDKYLEYVRLLSRKPPLVEDGPEKRIEQFQAIFGDLEKLDAELVRAMGRAG